MNHLLSLALATLVGTVVCYDTYHAPNTLSSRKLMVHLFEWKWSDIAKECESFLQHYGYGAVQISPPNEHILINTPNRPWWERYQPVSYKLVSRSGNEEQFKDMVTRCNNVGVRIVIDGVLNHMVGAGQAGTGSAGCGYTASSESFPCVSFSAQNFNDPKCSHNINNWNDINEIRYCRLVGLLDLDQSQQYVRQKMADYLNQMIDIGIAGFRLDAAKHMWPGDVKAIMDMTHDLNTNWFPAGSRAFCVQEVNEDNVVKGNTYFGSGRITNFNYGIQVSNVARGGNNWKYFCTLGSSWFNNYAAEDLLNFIDNHDTQRNGGPLTYKNGDQYQMAVTFMLAYPFGYSRVMSSYYFNSNDQAPPLDNSNNIASPTFNGDGTCNQQSGWVCEHRWPAIRRMADFHSTVEGTDKDNCVAGTNGIAFSRGAKGFFAANNDGNDWSQTFSTGLPAGTYCDVISGEPSNNKCTGKQVTVGSDGKAQISVQSKKTFAIHLGSNINCDDCSNPTDSPVTQGPDQPTDAPATDGTLAPGQAQRTVIFIHKQTSSGQDLFVRGGIDQARMSGCTTDADTSKCAIAIQHQTVVPSNFNTYLDWEQGDVHLDWYGAESGQGQHDGVTAAGTPLAWSTDDASNAGYQSLNHYGPHYWLVDMMMDCSQAYQGKYFELKGYLKGGDGWEHDIGQQDCSGSGGLKTPFSSKNHIGVCGKINVYNFDSNSCIVNDF